MNSYELPNIQSSVFSFESDNFRKDLLEFESSTELDFIDYQQPIITECAAHRGNTLQYFCKNDKKMFCSLCILN
jgi:hypothetical protein